MVNLQSLTLGEVALVEEKAQVSIDLATADETPKGKVLAALVYVFKRREDPKFTFTDALDMDLESAQAFLGIGVNDKGDDEGKASAAGEPKT